MEILEFKEPVRRRPPLGVITKASGGDDLYSHFLSRPVQVSGGQIILQNPDPVVLYESGSLGVAVYDDMLDKDSHLAGLIDTRINAVLGLERDVKPASDSAKHQRHAQFIRDMLAGISDWHDVLRRVLYFVVRGYSVAEIEWVASTWNGKPAWVVERVIDVDPTRVVFDVDWDLRLLTASKPFGGEEVPDRKFIVARYNARAGNPYGVGVGRTVWWNHYFKKNGLKFWLIFSEKFGMPTVIGKHPPGWSQKKREELVDTLQSIARETSIAIDTDLAVELLEARRTGSINTYQDLMDFLNSEMSKRVLGQTLTTEVGNVGSYAAANVHGDVRQEVLESDAKATETTITDTVIKWAIDYNFGEQPPNEYPHYDINSEPPDDLKAVAERDKILSDMGVEFGQKATLRRYDLPEIEEDDEPLKKPAPMTPPQLMGGGPKEPEEEDGDKGGAVGPGAGKQKFSEEPPIDDIDEAEQNMVEGAGVGALTMEFMALRRVIDKAVKEGKA